MKKVSNMYKKLSDKVKKKYITLAEVEKLRYQKDCDEFQMEYSKLFDHENNLREMTTAISEKL